MKRLFFYLCTLLPTIYSGCITLNTAPYPQESKHEKIYPVEEVSSSYESIIVLIDPTAAYGFGHTAMLIGNDQIGWTFISIPGRKRQNWYSNALTGGPAKKAKVSQYCQLADFIDDEHLDRYPIGLQFSIASNLHQEVLDAAFSSADDWFHILYRNCADVCSASLETAGFDPGYRIQSLPMYHPAIGSIHNSSIKTTLPSIPNKRFMRILHNNLNEWTFFSKKQGYIEVDNIESYTSIDELVQEVTTSNFAQKENNNEFNKLSHHTTVTALVK